MNEAVAHQRLIRDQLTRQLPREPAPNLQDYTVETISRADAIPIILRYEWLGTLGNATLFAGLVAPNGDLEGVACFGHGPGGGIRRVIGEPALCLERGACVHYAPRNAASFLINAACKLIHRTSGIERFFAYGDPEAGEYGAVYQAAGWLYLGQGLYSGKNRERRRALLPPGANPVDPAAWKTTQALRQGGRRLSYAEAKAAGWRLDWRAGKHVYATHVGKERKVWRRALGERPYPAPRPELKRKS